MNEPPERQGGRRRLREPGPGTPPPAARPAPRRAADPRAGEPRRTPSGQHELPQPSRARRAEPPPGYEAPPSGRRRRLEPPEPLPPVDDELDPRERRSAPARAARARHGLDEASEPTPPPGRRRAPESLPPGHPGRRQAQPGDRPVGMPANGPDAPRRARREPPPPPVREEPPTDVIPAMAPPPPTPPPPPARLAREQEEQAGDELFEDDEYYDEYEYDDAGYDDEYYEEDEYEEEPAKPRKKGKRALGWVAAIAVIALLAGGAWFGFNKIFGYEDFEGSGDGDVLFQVDDGDSTSAIGAKLANAGIVASGKAFVKAGEDNPKLAKIQHGYYVMKSHMSGAAAVDRIVSPDARVGQLEIRPYTQFDDITQPDGKVTPGVYSLMAKASCAQLNGKSTCVSADDLRKAVDEADLKTLGVPDWAVEPANNADRKDRRLEGLIAPGIYDVRPGATAQEILGQLVRSSTEAIQNAGLSPQSTGPGMTPYQTLIIASIIEREAVKPDFGKLSRVIYNRLGSNMRLQMDSTVNYVLDRPTLLTSDADRAKSGAYNTYKNTGLPPTPISVPSAEAIQAAVHPTPGDWVYFVKCEKNGLSCFAVTNEDHNKNVAEARAKGVF